MPNWTKEQVAAYENRTSSQKSRTRPFIQKSQESYEAGRVDNRPKDKKWMARCIQHFESQLSFDTPITGPETPTAPNPPSSIVSLLPHDDSWQWIPEQHIYCEKVEKGKEGAIIIIEKI